MSNAASQRPDEVDPDVASSAFEYITPHRVGAMVVAGIRANAPHILTHPAPVEALRARTEAVIAGAPRG